MKSAQEIIQNGSFNKLWGGVIEKFNYDIANHEIVINIHVLENGIYTYYKINFLGVVKFLFSHEDDQEKWDYISLTSIGIEREGELCRIGAELWESEMVIKCQEVFLSTINKKI